MSFSYLFVGFSDPRSGEDDWVIVEDQKIAERYRSQNPESLVVIRSVILPRPLSQHEEGVWWDEEITTRIWERWPELMEESPSPIDLR